MARLSVLMLRPWHHRSGARLLHLCEKEYVRHLLMTLLQVAIDEFFKDLEFQVLYMMRLLL